MVQQPWGRWNRDTLAKAVALMCAAQGSGGGDWGRSYIGPATAQSEFEQRRAWEFELRARQIDACIGEWHRRSTAMRRCALLS